MFQVSIEFILFKLKVVVTSCGVVGCAKNRSKAPKEGFFRLPSKMNRGETSQKLSGQRHDVWLSRICRKDLTPSQLAEKNSTLHVCVCLNHSTQTGLQVSILDTKKYQLFLHQSQLANEIQGGRDDIKVKLYRWKTQKKQKNPSWND